MAVARQKEVFFGSPGSASISRLIGEWLKQKGATGLTNVAYPSSAPAHLDMMGGRLPVMIDGLAPTLQLIQTGKLRALASTGAERSRLVPDLPTIAERGLPDYDTRIWFGIVAPARTPEAVIRKLADALRRTQDSNDVRELLAQQGMEPFRGFPQFMRALANLQARQAKLLQIQADLNSGDPNRATVAQGQLLGDELSDHQRQVGGADDDDCQGQRRGEFGDRGDRFQPSLNVRCNSGAAEHEIGRAHV